MAGRSRNPSCVPWTFSIQADIPPLTQKGWASFKGRWKAPTGREPLLLDVTLKALKVSMTNASLKIETVPMTMQKWIIGRHCHSQRALRIALGVLAMMALWQPGVAQSPSPLSEIHFEHRVVVATTSLDRELDVDESLSDNVNRLAAIGFEVGAILAGNGPLIDRMLQRKPYVAGLVDHSGHVFVIMNRPVGQPVPVREYRLLHTRTPFGVEEIVAAYGREGFRLTLTAWEGEHFHGVFERIAGVEGMEPVDYRVFRNQRRRGWNVLMLEDPDVRQRLRRVVPITLDSALLELGPPAESPAEFVWESDAPNQRSRLRTRLSARAAQGFRAQMVRLRGNELDIPLLKPAGASVPGPAMLLDEGPWGSPCGRGSIVGADNWTDGNVYCVAEEPQGAVRNLGFDVNLAPEGSADDDLFRDWLPCEMRARLRSSRAGSTRVARALQIEHEIQRKVKPGHRVTRAFAIARENQDDQLVFFTTQSPPPVVNGQAAPSTPAPRIVAEVDGLLQSSLAQREQELNETFSAEMRQMDVIAWAEIYDTRANQHVQLHGCAPSRMARDHAETVLRGYLVRTPYSKYRIRNQLIVEAVR